MTETVEIQNEPHVRRFATADSMYMEAEMLARAKRRIIVIVEGEDDQMVLAPHANDELVLMTGPGGRDKLFELANRADDRQVQQLLFMADSDYDRFSSNSHSLSNVIMSARHDFFMELFSTSRNILANIVRKRLESSSRRGAVGEVDTVEPVGELVVPSREDANEAIEAAVRLSRSPMSVRAAASKFECSFNFRRMRIGQLNSNVLDVDLILDCLLPDSNISPSIVEEVRSEAKSIYLDNSLETLSYVGDHDFFFSLSAILREKGVRVKHSSLQDDLIISCRCSGILETPSVAAIQEFAESFGKRALNCPC